MNKLKYYLFNTFSKIPDRYVPFTISKWINDMAEKELRNAKSDIIKLRWEQIQLENQLKEMKSKK